MNRTLSLEVLEERQLLAGLDEAPMGNAESPAEDTAPPNHEASIWSKVGALCICAAFTLPFIYEPLPVD